MRAGLGRLGFVGLISRMLLGDFKVDFESVWVGLELICARLRLQAQTLLQKTSHSKTDRPTSQPTRRCEAPSRGWQRTNTASPWTLSNRQATARTASCLDHGFPVAGGRHLHLRV